MASATYGWARSRSVKPPSSVSRSRSDAEKNKNRVRNRKFDSRSQSVLGERTFKKSTTTNFLSLDESKSESEEERRKRSLTLFSKDMISSKLFNSSPRSTPGSPGRIEKGPLLAETLGLNLGQKRALQTTWLRIYDPARPKTAVEVMERVFETLSRKEPKISSLFAGCAFVSRVTHRALNDSRIETPHDHAKFLVWFTDEMVTKLDFNGNYILGQMHEFGEKHRKLKTFGLSSKVWDRFGESFVEVLAAHETIRRYPDAPKAWNLLAAAVVDNVCCGFNRK